MPSYPYYFDEPNVRETLKNHRLTLPELRLSTGEVIRAAATCSCGYIFAADGDNGSSLHAAWEAHFIEALRGGCSRN